MPVPESLTDTLSRGLGDFARGLDNGAAQLETKFTQALDAYVPNTVRSYVEQAFGQAPTPDRTPASLTSASAAVERAPSVAGVPAGSAEPADTGLLQDAIAGAFGTLRAGLEYLPSMDALDLGHAVLVAFPDQPELRAKVLELLKRIDRTKEKPEGTLDVGRCLLALEVRFRGLDLSRLSRRDQLGINLTTGFALGMVDGLQSVLSNAEAKALEAATKDPINKLELDCGLTLGLIAGVLYGIAEDLLTTIALCIAAIAAAVVAPYVLPVLLLLIVLSTLYFTMTAFQAIYTLTGRANHYAASPEAFLADIEALQQAMQECFERLKAAASSEIATQLSALDTSLRRACSLMVYLAVAPNALLSEGKELGREVGTAAGAGCKEMLQRNAFFNAGFTIGYQSGYVIYVIASLFLAYGDVLKAAKGGMAVLKKLLSAGSDLVLPQAVAIGRKLGAGPFGQFVRKLSDASPSPAQMRSIKSWLQEQPDGSVIPVELLEPARTLVGKREVATDLKVLDNAPAASLAAKFDHPVPGTVAKFPPARIPAPPVPPAIVTDARGVVRPAATSVERALLPSARGLEDTILEPAHRSLRAASDEAPKRVATLSPDDISVRDLLWRVDDPQLPVLHATASARNATRSTPRRPGIEGVGRLDETVAVANYSAQKSEVTFPSWNAVPLVVDSRFDQALRALGPATKRLRLNGQAASPDVGAALRSWTERDFRQEMQDFQRQLKLSQAGNLLALIKSRYHRLSPTTRTNARERLGYRIPEGKWRDALYLQWEDWGIAKRTDKGWMFLDVKIGKFFPEDEVDIGHVTAAVLHHQLLAAILRKGPGTAQEKELARRIWVDAFNRDFNNYLPQLASRNRTAGGKLRATYAHDESRTVLEVLAHPDYTDKLDWTVRLAGSLPKLEKAAK